MPLPRGFTSIKQLAKSNEEVLTQYNSLAWYAVRKYQRTYHFSEDQTEELYRRLLVYLFGAPLSYRNQRGMSKIIGTKLAGLRHGILELECETELEPVHCERPESFDDTIRHRSPDYLSPDSRINLSVIASQLSILTSSEMAVVRLLYGIEGAKICNVNMICRKLGRPRYWVSRRIESAVLKLQRSLRLPETTKGLNGDFKRH